MVFGTAGYTQAHFRNDGWWDIDALGAGRNSQNFSGYFFSGGVEVLLRSNFYLRGELRYSDFGKEITNSGFDGSASYVEPRRSRDLHCPPWHRLQDGSR